MRCRELVRQARRWAHSASSSSYSSAATASAASTTGTVTAAAAGGSSTMRAAVLWEVGKPLAIEQLQMPRPQLGEVLLKTHACGVCHSDLHVIKGEQPFPLPAVLGHEVTGEVVEHGPGTDAATLARLPLGTRAVGAFIMPCGGCFFCYRGQEDLCEAFFKHNRARGTLYDGTTRLYLAGKGTPVQMYSMGGLAEYCVIPASAVAPLPPSLPFSESAIIGCAVFTAYGAMRHAADLRAGESVAVLGVGGVGTACLQVARAFGAATIVAVDVDDGKLARAREMGATHTVNAAREGEEEAVERIREAAEGGRGVDVAVEALGKPSTFVQASKAVRDGGRAVMVGLPKLGDVAGVDITRLVRRQVRIIGSYGGRARQDLPTILRLAEAGAFDLASAVTRRCSLEQADQAYSALNQGKVLGRALVEMSNSC